MMYNQCDRQDPHPPHGWDIGRAHYFCKGLPHNPSAMIDFENANIVLGEN